MISLLNSIHSLYQEALYSRVTHKLSYFIFSLIGKIDRVKRAADRYIRTENQIASTNLNNSESRNDLVAYDINEVISNLGNMVSEQLFPIVAGGCSGLGNLTARLQVQRGENSLGGDLDNNISDSPRESEYCVDAPPLLPVISDHRGPAFVQFDSFEATTYSSDNNIVGGIINNCREPRLAIENGAQLSTIPSASSCLSDYQHLPDETYCAIEAVSNNIDEWRGHLVTRLKQYTTRVTEIQMTASNAISNSDLNAYSFSSVSARLDH